MSRVGDRRLDIVLQLDQAVGDPSATQVQSVAVHFQCTVLFVDISGTLAYNIWPTDPNDGYFVFDQHGGLTSFGNDNYLAYLDGAQYYEPNAPIVGMRATPDGGGYWMVGSDGGVFASGDAGFYGSTGNLHLNKPVVGMAATPDGGGYWFVASDGGIFAYGDAQFYGSMGGKPLNKPIVGMAATPSGNGYWLVASDGGIFAFGDAQFYGSTGSIQLNQPIVGMSATPSGQGYWFVAADGGVFSYGDAQFFGSTTNVHLTGSVVGMTSTYSGGATGSRCPMAGCSTTALQPSFPAAWVVRGSRAWPGSRCQVVPHRLSHGVPECRESALPIPYIAGPGRLVISNQYSPC